MDIKELYHQYRHRVNSFYHNDSRYLKSLGITITAAALAMCLINYALNCKTERNTQRGESSEEIRKMNSPRPGSDTTYPTIDSTVDSPQPLKSR